MIIPLTSSSNMAHPTQNIGAINPTFTENADNLYVMDYFEYLICQLNNQSINQINSLN